MTPRELAAWEDLARSGRLRTIMECANYGDLLKRHAAELRLGK